jgi:glycerol kinase
MSLETILSIDQGTTSSRALVVNKAADVLACAQQTFPQIFPNDAWVEHDPEAIWQSVLDVCKKAMSESKLTPKDIAAIGITNQRETTLVWRKDSGKPIYNAIVWQDRRTAASCAALKAQDATLESQIQAKTGLRLDPYFSATKLAWILDNVEGARDMAKRGELLFGTIDSFLIWRLTGGKQHVTDVTNASRTLLYDIHRLDWDDALLDLFNIPKTMLPTVLENCADFGVTDEAVFGARIPIAGVAGDQHAASVAQAIFEPGMAKSTYGTGCFVMVNTGETAVKSKHRLLSTILYRIHGKTHYALEGSIFNAGAAVKWLCDSLNMIAAPAETESLAKSLKSNEGVYLVPAFTGLGAPYWNPDARGAMFGITRATGRAHFARAVLEAVCYQSRDLFQAIQSDDVSLKAIRVDGGMTENQWLLQFLADIVDVQVERSACIEATALGAAYLAGLQVGMFSSLTDIASRWQKTATYDSQMDESCRQSLYTGWQNALKQLV